MSIFGSIWNKMTGGTESTAPPTTTAAPPTTTESTAPPTTTAAPSTPPATPTDFSPEPTAEAVSSEVDVEQILEGLAAKGGPNHWKTSIVDFLKLLDLDSSLAARTELAEELNVHAGAHGSAEQNTALHRAVMQKLEENGGKVPDSLKG